MHLVDSRDQQPHMLDLGEPVRIYSCGYTPRERIHLGNARPFVLADLLRRAVDAAGAEAVLVQAVSDVDRRVDAAASAADQTRQSFVAARVEAYLADSSSIGVRASHRRPVASDHIEAMIGLVAALHDQGLTTEDEAGLRLTGAPSLASVDLEHLDPDGVIRSMMCFTGQQWDVRREPLLWRRGLTSGWCSPWGTGLPDESVVCAALAHTYLGTPVSVHVGSVDLYSHHEIEMAAGTFAYGDELATTWIHSGLVHVGGQRMANSAGNVIPVHQAVAEVGPDAVRLLYLGTHYAEPLDADRTRLHAARSRADRLRSAIGSAPQHAEESGLLSAVRGALDADLDTPLAINLLEEAAAGTVGQAELRAASSLLGVLQM